jgi:hypothetical protein
MKKALIYKGKLVQISDEEFEVPNTMTWVDCGDDVEEFWEYNSSTGSFTNPIPPITIEDIYQRILDDIKRVRQEKETGGITINGVQVSTDRQSQSLIIGARIAAKEALDNSEAYVINWKADNGWIQLDAPTIIHISNVVREHVQACFDAENAHDIAVTNLRDANDIEALENYNISTGWPV